MSWAVSLEKLSTRISWVPIQFFVKYRVIFRLNGLFWSSFPVIWFANDPVQYTAVFFNFWWRSFPEIQSNSGPGNLAIRMNKKLTSFLKVFKFEFLRLTLSDTIKFLDRRMQMVTTSLNKCGSEMQQKAMAGQAIEKEITDKMKNMEIYNKIYQWILLIFCFLRYSSFFIRYHVMQITCLMTRFSTRNSPVSHLRSSAHFWIDGSQCISRISKVGWNEK